MTTANQFTAEQFSRIAAMNKEFEEQLQEGSQGHIGNEDNIAKAGLTVLLQESEEFRDKFNASAVAKIGAKR